MHVLNVFRELQYIAHFFFQTNVLYPIFHSKIGKREKFNLNCLALKSCDISFYFAISVQNTVQNRYVMQVIKIIDSNQGITPFK